MSRFQPLATGSPWMFTSPNVHPFALGVFLSFRIGERNPPGNNTYFPVQADPGGRARPRVKGTPRRGLDTMNFRFKSKSRQMEVDAFHSMENGTLSPFFPTRGREEKVLNKALLPRTKRRWGWKMEMRGTISRSVFFFFFFFGSRNLFRGGTKAPFNGGFF